MSKSVSLAPGQTRDDDMPRRDRRPDTRRRRPSPPSRPAATGPGSGDPGDVRAGARGRSPQNTGPTAGGDDRSRQCRHEQAASNTQSREPRIVPWLTSIPWNMKKPGRRMRPGFLTVSGAGCTGLHCDFSCASASAPGALVSRRRRRPNWPGRNATSPSCGGCGSTPRPTHWRRELSRLRTPTSRYRSWWRPRSGPVWPAAATPKSKRYVTYRRTPGPWSTS